MNRATIVCENAAKIGCSNVATPNDLVSNSPLVNILFLADLFNTKHGLEELTKEVFDVANKLAKMDDDDFVGSHEERAFRQWINSLGIEDVFINNLYEDLRDGIVLCKVIHKIDSTLIDWKRVIDKPINIFKKGINCEVGIEACRKLKVQLIGIGSHDIRDGNKKLILAVIW